MSEFPSEASALLRRVAEPRPVGDSVKAAIRRSARRLGWSFSRTKTVWYGEARRIDAGEMDQLRAAARKAKKEATPDDIADLRRRIARLERWLDGERLADGDLTGLPAPGETLPQHR